MKLLKMLHFKCRNGKYPLSQIERFHVNDNQVAWNVPFKDYDPPKHEAPSLKHKPWADPDINTNFNPNWNALDVQINRKSHMGDYILVDNVPQNPMGRTGLIGRGVLGRWGPNHAADPIVTRWKTLDAQKISNETTKLPILQFCAIQRRDCNEWAIPGGMVDPGEHISETLRREFMEEALNSLERNIDNERKVLEEFFKCGKEIYKGYVDDPRNTDNAWMETIAYNFHDETGNIVGKINLNAGDDAKGVQWMDISKELTLYASHKNFIQKVVQIHNAHW